MDIRDVDLPPIQARLNRLSTTKERRRRAAELDRQYGEYPPLDAAIERTVLFFRLEQNRKLTVEVVAALMGIAISKGMVRQYESSNPNQHCPACGGLLFKERRPVGEIGVCAGCSAVATIQQDGKVRLVTEAEWRAWPDGLRAEIADLRRSAGFEDGG